MTDEDNRHAEPSAARAEGKRSRPQRRQQLSLLDRIEQAITSLFFILLGIAFLYIAYKTMYAAHATFTFVLVVVGVAILLYGTGTQGAGNFNSDAGVLTYKIGIAGGAGILALCIGYGVLEYSQQMREAFAIERKYVRVSIVPLKGISEVNFSHYFPDANTTSGEIVPAVRRGNEAVEIYVPYFPAETKKVINLSLYHVESDHRPPQLRPMFNNQYQVEQIAGGTGETLGGLEFPIFSGKIKAVHGMTGSEDESVFDNSILVDLVDPKYKEQKDRDANELTHLMTDAPPPPPILPAVGAM